MTSLRSLFCILIFSLPFLQSDAQKVTGSYWRVDYPASTAKGELQIAVTYQIWIPDGVKKIRAVIIHQHGAGTTAANAGRTASEDLQWQALAAKWDCALLGPSYHVLNERIDDSTGSAELWFDPRRGSDRALLRALRQLGGESGHPELADAPWCLWGHSGGGIWSDIMTMLYPERVIAVWLRSGTAFMFRGMKEFAQPDTIPGALYRIPIVCNPGIKENKNRVGIGNLATFKEYRAAGGLVCFAEDPLSGHDCGYSRSLAIPFFDACLSMRLPDSKNCYAPLKPIDTTKAWLGSLTDKTAYPAKEYKGNSAEAVWLPNERIAKDWMEYVRTGAVKDNTPPPAPFDLFMTDSAGSALLSWNTTADFESGVGGFIILRDGKELAKLLPEHPELTYGHGLFQFGKINYYHDTPEYPVPQMKYADSTAKGTKHQYAVIALNSEGLRSKETNAKWK
ncbi:MAG TPA: hypothetical protein VG890_09380 [Puia sp.]|nr:hypothetical protein [Puia sp.]